MNAKKIITLLLAAVLVLSLAACGTKPAENGGGDGEPQTLEEAKTLYDQLVAQENAIQAENTELWEKVFLSADKGMAMMEDGKNYGEFLLSTIEAAKEQFTDEEYELLKEKATEIKNIEDRLAALEEKFPSLSETPAEDGIFLGHQLLVHGGRLLGVLRLIAHPVRCTAALCAAWDHTGGQHQRQQQCDDFLYVHFVSSVFNLSTGSTGSFLPSPKP